MSIYRKGRDVAYGSDKNHGYPCLLVRPNPRAKNYKVVGEPVHVHVPINCALATTGIPVFTAIGKSYAVIAIEEVHTVAEATAATSNLKVERCQGTEAAAAGDDLLAATGIDLKGTKDTLQAGTVITTSDINVLADGNRLVVHAALDNATPEATTEYVGCVSIHLVPVTMDDESTS